MYHLIRWLIRTWRSRRAAVQAQTQSQEQAPDAPRTTSGSGGKATTVRTLGTLFAPTSGSASVAEIPLSPENGAEIRRRISSMPESPGRYLRLSLHRAVRPAGRGGGAGAMARAARPAALHPAAGRLVDLGRDRDLHPVRRGPGRAAARRAGELPLGPGDGADRVQRDPRVAGARHRRAVLLLLLIGLGWQITSAAFQRERLISGTR